MKLKTTILALSTCAISALSAQTEAPAKPATEKATTEQVKAETPVEVQAFKLVDIVSNTLPEILGSVKDEATLMEAEAELDKMLEKIKIEEAALLKLEVPDNEARKKTAAKMKLKQSAMQKKIMPAMANLQQLSPDITMKLTGLMAQFAQTMQETMPKTEKYFLTDEELKAKKDLIGQ